MWRYVIPIVVVVLAELLMFGAAWFLSGRGAKEVR